jgi:hypothetical protein
MPSSTTGPAAGVNQIGSDQVLDQRNVILPAFPGSAVFGKDRDQGDKQGLDGPWRQSFYVGSIPKINISIFQYPEYDRGDAVFQARNWLSWRVVGVTAGQVGLAVDQLVGGDSEVWMPLTTPQLMPVGQPISFSFNAGGFNTVAVEFDTTANRYTDIAPFPLDTPEQGFDRVVVTFSASI